MSQASTLVIVESPAKAKTINKYLGRNFVVRSSIGHVRDLPKAGQQKLKKGQKATKFTRMGIEPNNNWKAHYAIIPGKEKVVNDLKILAKKSEKIILATDPDREGEAIAWHLQQVIEGATKAPFFRVAFHEITKPAITKAFENLGIVDQKRVDAQQTRRFLDRIVGFELSPLLWKKVARGLSAGRVQSVALRLIVDREREIQAFVAEEYWLIKATLQAETTPIIFDVTSADGKKFKCNNQTASAAVVATLRQAQYVVQSAVSTAKQSRPSPPFITSTLQQAASTRLGYGVKQTMMLAQRLYEAGHITYMRTDSTSVSQQALADVRGFIDDKYGKAYLPESANYYKSKGNAQEAHEAIRPTDATNTAPDAVTQQAAKLYELIRCRFVSSQMTPARHLVTKLDVSAAKFGLTARGRVLEFDGFTKVWPVKDEQQSLPLLTEGSTLQLQTVNPSQHFTKPPQRFSESGLVRELEKRGIGRPSTYASIISTIQDRGYARLENKSFCAEKIGEVVVDRLSESFSELMNYNFTASMEEKLDAIATGAIDWIKVLDEFYLDFGKQLEHADGISTTAMREKAPTPTPINCAKCGRVMNIRIAATGMFLSCSGYSEKGDDKCSNTMNLADASDMVDIADEAQQAEEQRNRKRCPVCNTAMAPFLVDSKTQLHICTNNPDCSGVTQETGNFVVKGSDASIIECDKCANEMELKSGRFGKYFSCTSETCSNTRKVLANGQPAPPKMTPIPMEGLRCKKVDDFYLLRDGAAGLFLAASKFPKNRETRPVQVMELIPHKVKIEEKYQYFFTAPKFDPAGNPTEIRFSRKIGEQYLSSQKDGKQTKWRCFYKKSKWVSNEK